MRAHSLIALAVGAIAQTQTVLAATSLPSYVLDYAPLIYFHSKEVAWLSSLETHLAHVPLILDDNYTPVAGAPTPTLDNLNDPRISNKSVYLTAPDDVNGLPAWLLSEYGKPDSTGKSSAPTIVIVTDHKNGTVDAFYFEFMSFNLGPFVVEEGTNIGDHVGDWEHQAIRFENGKPTLVWLSAHATGNGYTYDALDKRGVRPVTYNALGSHANYATQGEHAIVDLIVYDYTDQGILWDPAANVQAWYFDNSTGTPKFTPTPETTMATNWLYSFVEWGDQEFKSSDPRQCEIVGQKKWSSGPTGPIDKTLNRTWYGFGIDSSEMPASSLPAYQSGSPIKVVGGNCTKVLGLGTP